MTSLRPLPICILLACCNGKSAAPPPAATTTLPAAPSAAARESANQAAEGALLSLDEPALVGTLVANERQSLMHPAEYCLDDGQVYAGAPARIGKLNVFTQRSLGGLAGATVIARGTREASLLAALRKIGSCPADYGSNPAEMPQMRSDWVSPEGGFKTTRSKLEKLPCFRARELALVELGSDVQHQGDRVTLVLHNPFAGALDTLEAHAHYEGGPGKPMPLFRNVELHLPPGGKQELELPAQIEAGPAGKAEDKPRGYYRLRSVDLAGKVGKVEFDGAQLAIPSPPR